jgi:hypothetical protein
LKNKIYLRLAISIFLTNWLVNKDYYEFQLIWWNYCCDNNIKILIIKVGYICLNERGERERHNYIQFNKWLIN